jgi:hypothetical protein
MVDHPCAQVSANNLGVVLYSQGKHEEVEVMYRYVLVGHEKAQGIYHPNTPACVNKLGIVLNG